MKSAYSSSDYVPRKQASRIHALSEADQDLKEIWACPLLQKRKKRQE